MSPEYTHLKNEVSSDKAEASDPHPPPFLISLPSLGVTVGTDYLRGVSRCRCVLGVSLDVPGAAHLVLHVACAVRVGEYRRPGSFHPPPGAPLGGPGRFFSDRWLTEEQYCPNVTELESAPLVRVCQWGRRADTEPSDHWR